MYTKIKLGCITTAIVLGLAALIFFRPISRKMTDWTFDQTTRHVAAALPFEERAEAEAICEELWTRVKTDGVPPEHTERFSDFRKETFGMLQNNEVTEDEAREFVERVRAVLEDLYPVGL